MRHTKKVAWFFLPTHPDQNLDTHRDAHIRIEIVSNMLGGQLPNVEVYKSLGVKVNQKGLWQQPPTLHHLDKVAES